MAEQGDISGRKRGFAGTWPPRAAAPFGGLAPSRPAFWPPLIETLRAWARAETGAGRLLPWVPVVVKKVDLPERRVEVEWGADW